MNNTDSKQFLLFLRRMLLGGLVGFVSGAVGMNLLQPYDILLRPRLHQYASSCASTALFAEAGYDMIHFNACGRTANALTIVHNDQRSLAMLNGYSDSSREGQLRITIDAEDDGIRGHFAVAGDLKLDYATALSVNYFFAPCWSFQVHLPFYQMRLERVSWQDLTKKITPEDFRVHDLLTDSLFTTVDLLGNGLCLQGWRRAGFGDCTCFVEWGSDFPQPRPLLKNVHIFGRVGLTLPTGRLTDADLIATLPFGSDGSWCIPFGFGLDVDLGTHCTVGFDVLLTHRFGTTRLHRIKTSIDQTELLLLSKQSAYNDFGMRQQFDLFIEFRRLAELVGWCDRGLSFLVGYQFVKNGEDQLSFRGNQFAPEIANTAEVLQERTYHQIVCRATYDAVHWIPESCCIKPSFSLFTRQPFNGKRSSVARTFGASLSFEF